MENVESMTAGQLLKKLCSVMGQLDGLDSGLVEESCVAKEHSRRAGELRAQLLARIGPEPENGQLLTELTDTVVTAQNSGEDKDPETCATIVRLTAQVLEKARRHDSALQIV